MDKKQTGLESLDPIGDSAKDMGKRLEEALGAGGAGTSILDAVKGNMFRVEPREVAPNIPNLIRAQGAYAGLADSVYEALMKQVEAFSTTLKPDEELVGALASFGQRVSISITGIGYQNPHIMRFDGIDANGEPVVLLQHTSQVNVLLSRVKVTGRPPIRIGFAAPTT